MTRQSAVQSLFYLWLIGAVVLALVLLGQSIAGKYGDDDAAAWSWFLSLVVAPFSLLTVAAFVDPSASWRNAAANTFKFRAGFIASFGVLLVGLATLLIEPLLQMNWFDLFSRSGIVIALLQAPVMAAVGGVVFDRR